MTLVTQAAVFAAHAHDGATRKGSQIPYIVHPMEAAAIAATLTDDPHVVAAAMLHDVMEDCGVSFEELRARFGERVATLVRDESQSEGPESRASWGRRKREAVRRLARGSRDAKIICLSDKLRNMRAIFRDVGREGDAVFLRFNKHDKRQHAWYYRSCAALMEGELGRTLAWQELSGLIAQVFGGVESLMPEDAEEEEVRAHAI